MIKKYEILKKRLLVYYMHWFFFNLQLLIFTLIYYLFYFLSICTDKNKNLYSLHYVLKHKIYTVFKANTWTSSQKIQQLADKIRPYQEK